MPPQKPDPWTDIYPAVYWPNAAPQLLDNFYSNRYLAFTDYWHYDDVSENCLGINVWTPGYNDNVKRPVMLWIHGGGFTSGNSIEHPEYHGENLSRKENVVFCSLNHRLGPLRFCRFRRYWRVRSMLHQVMWECSILWLHLNGSVIIYRILVVIRIRNNYWSVGWWCKGVYSDCHAIGKRFISQSGGFEWRLTEIRGKEQLRKTCILHSKRSRFKNLTDR